MDLIIDTGSTLGGVEIKSARTIVPEFFIGLDRLAQALDRPMDRTLVHGGDLSHVQRGVRVVPWHRLGAERWGLPRRRRGG